jgi:hypothetical protein
MKQALLNYDKTHKVGGKHYWRRELQEATPNLDEPWDIFGMRLVELAERGYPGDKKECALQLRQHFLESLPPSFKVKIIDAERALRVTSGGKTKCMNLTNLMLMANELQRERPKSIMWSSNTESGVRDQHSQTLVFSGARRSTSQLCSSRNEVKTSSGKDQRDHNSTPQQKLPSSGRTVKPTSSPCTYCKNPNHHRKVCWKAAKLCLICGGKHHIEYCQKYDPGYRSRSKSPKRMSPGNGVVSM